MNKYTYYTTNDVQIECWYELEEKEEPEFVDNIQVTSGYPAYVDLYEAKINGADVYEILSDSTIRAIEAEILKENSDE